MVDTVPVGRPLTPIDPALAREAVALVAERERIAGELEANRRRRDDLIVRMRAAGYGPDIVARVLQMSKARVLGVLREHREGSGGSSASP